MADIEINQLNHAVISLRFSSEGIARELSEYFTFEAHNYRFNPLYKARKWDGRIRLFNSRNSTIIAGVVPDILKFANDKGYTVEDNTDIMNTVEFSLQEAKEFADTLNLPIEPRDYQLRAFALAVRSKRCILLSPTASGKSLIAYLIARFYGLKTLIVVPTIQLVHQLIGDFQEYGYKDNVHGIMGGKTKDTQTDITVSTWQSVYDMPASYFTQFDVIIGDEAHNFKAKSLTEIMTKMVDTKYRIGMSGTLDDAEVNKLVLRGLFGRIHEVEKTTNLMNQGFLANLNIKVLILNHTKEMAKELQGIEYEDEVKYIIGSEPRNRFIRNLALSLPGNTLILYSRVEKHGKILYDMIAAKHPNTHFVSGEVDGKDREDIRKLVETSDDAKIVASYGVFSTGTNMKRIHNVIFAFPSKSRIRVLQSIGRGLRIGDGKDVCTLFDIADKITGPKDRNNFTLNHMIERVKIYVAEGFQYELHSIDLKPKSTTNSIFKA